MLVIYDDGERLVCQETLRVVQTHLVDIKGAGLKVLLEVDPLFLFVSLLF